MHRADLLWSFLGILTKERFEALLEVFGDLEHASRHVGADLLRNLGCRQETVLRVLQQLENFREDDYERKLMEKGIDLVSLHDARYPRLLRDIADAPVFLHVRGDLSILDQACVALVGTRTMSLYGKRVVESFVAPLVQAGVVTVSGLAHGVDALVAEETMKNGGKTVAVLGHGLGKIYPRRNTLLAEEIVAKGGLLVSEFPLDFPPDTYTFPARNRIIAGLSLATVVLEAPGDSGAIITAVQAFGYGRDVFAVPGQIFDLQYAGTHALVLRNQARLVTSPQEILQELGIVASEEGMSGYRPSTPEEEKLFQVLTTMPQPVDLLVERSGLSAAQISSALTMMELSGGAKNIGAGSWVRV